MRLYNNYAHKNVLGTSIKHQFREVLMGKLFAIVVICFFFWKFILLCSLWHTPLGEVKDPVRFIFPELKK